MSQPHPPVERDEDRDLGDRGQAAGQRVHILRLVQLLDGLVRRLRVVGIPCLELFNLPFFYLDRYCTIFFSFFFGSFVFLVRERMSA